MRKKLLSSFVLCALAFASCTDDNPAPGPAPVPPAERVATQAFYGGDRYDAGTGNIWINFISEMEYDELEETYIGPGFIVCLDFNTALAANPDFATLAAGTYTVEATDTHAAFTLNTADGDSYVTRYDAAGSSVQRTVTGGTVTVAADGDRYTIDAKLRLDDGSAYDCRFEEPIRFINRTGEGQMSNLTQSVVLDDLTQGLVVYQGEAFTESSDLYLVLLAGPDYDLDINYGASDAVMLSLNVAPGSRDGIPSGTYTIIDAETADDYAPNTALSGVYDATYGGYFGTWYFSTRDMVEASMRGGSVTVTRGEGNRYTFELHLKDGYDNAVEGTFAGTCRVEDWS